MRGTLGTLRSVAEAGARAGRLAESGGLDAQWPGETTALRVRPWRRGAFVAPLDASLGKPPEHTRRGGGVRLPVHAGQAACPRSTSGVGARAPGSDRARANQAPRSRPDFDR